MAGEEISRAFTFGNNPKRHVRYPYSNFYFLFIRMLLILEQGEYVEASPCESADLPQTRLEPILLRYATQNGFRLRFDTEFLSFSEDEKTGKIESVVEDLVTGSKLSIRSKYLCGADGANSSIVRELQLPLHDEPFQGLALNVLIEADMVNHAHLLRFNTTLISGICRRI